MPTLFVLGSVAVHTVMIGTRQHVQ
jgi:hypothetical protein